MLLELFDKSVVSSYSFSRAKHLCCDVCALQCTCDTINCPNIDGSMGSLIKKGLRSDVMTSQKVRPVSIEQKNRLQILLEECQKCEREELLKTNPKLFYSNIDNVTCFTNRLIQETVSKCDLPCSVEDILEKV